MRMQKAKMSSVASPPNVMQKPIDGSDASTARATGSNKPPTPIDVSDELYQSELDPDELIDFDDTDATELPPLEEALDFLISIMEE
ncbi:hypothetical protein V7S43_014232 [Phytophthora oleae]|uniref:Uncharacterized protein n=1 Tax=Phytophthora oleae TaxID=2107226 RepID=A0ABD3F478_9STRA